MSTTFSVDNVAPSTERFEVAPVRNVMEQGRPQMSTDAPLPPRHQAPDVANPTRVHSVRADAQELVLPTTSRFVGGAPHPLFEALSVAYDRHMPVSLSPDHLWTVILQGISHHINSDPEAHRDTLVSHRGKKTIVVALDDFVWGEDNRWEDAFPVFFKTLREDMGEQASAFFKPFSTTTEVASSVSHLLLMDSVKEFYSYTAITLEACFLLTTYKHNCNCCL